jgi:hypothetical protein
VKYTDPDGRYLVYSWVDHEAGCIRYGMGTYRDKSGIFSDPSFRLNYITNAIASFIPFVGNFIPRAQRALGNAIDAVTGSNFHMEFNSAEKQLDGASLAIDIVASTPAGRASNAIKALGRAMTFMGVADAAGDWGGDGYISQFLEKSSYSVLGKAQSKEEALASAALFAKGAEAFFTMNLEDKGISATDWAAAIQDVMQGKENELFSSVVGGN